jgi:hypothetical protein
VWLTGDENAPVLLAYDALGADGSLHINLIKYDTFAKMQANVQTELVTLPKTNGSAYESKPTIYEVDWRDFISNSEIKLWYEYEDASGNVKMA